ncbi:MAG: hypothetical protein VX095_05160 [Pseudomonadota bacterium]|nr:hypothetical protein [Pseudomonadota bacterium]
MNILETDHWCMMLPEEWHAENDDDVIRIVDQDDVGEIKITTLHKQSGRVNTSDVTAMASAESPEITKWHQTRAGEFEGVTSVYCEDDASVREWYLGSESLVLYITYVCAREDEGLDDASVDELLGTLVVGDSQAA